ncbi:MAG: phasin family protein [Proteobacteria bacterium]|nr:phasin family protein [Pseudomonadota bacterium]
MVHTQASLNWPSSLYNFQPFQGSMGTWLNLNKITMQMCSEIMMENLNTCNELIQCNLELMKEIKKFKNPEGWMNAQNYWTSSFAPTCYQYSQHMLEILTRAAAEYNKCFSKEMHHFEQEKKAKH